MKKIAANIIGLLCLLNANVYADGLVISNPGSYEIKELTPSVSDSIGIDVTSSGKIVINCISENNRYALINAGKFNNVGINISSTSDVTLTGEALHIVHSPSGDGSNISVLNDGILTINNDITLGYDNKGIINNGTLNLSGDIYDARGSQQGIITNNNVLNILSGGTDGKIINYNSININGVDSKYVYNIENNSKLYIYDNLNGIKLDYLSNYGTTVINNNKYLDILFNIQNSGELHINNNEDVWISCAINHQEGAITDISLKGNSSNISPNGVSSNWITSNILGSDLGGFKLTLEEKGIWEAYAQAEPVTGIVLNGGSIIVSNNYNTLWHDQPNSEWTDDYKSLTLNNFTSDGNFKYSDAFGDFYDPAGGIYLYTDLANDIGDKVVFTGTTPDATIPLGIINKSDHDGKPIAKEEGHSVTIIEAPSDTKMQFNSSLFVYGTSIGYIWDTDNGEEDKNVAHNVFNPIVEEEIVDDIKKWNFVGWEKGAPKNVVSELKQQENDPNINIIDIDNTLKRLNDIRTDPSEVGVWIRGERGKTKISSYGYEYSLTSGGYDWIHENDNANVFAGVGISYSQNDCDTGIIGDTKSLGFNLYGSWYGKKNHDYVDVIVKYGRLDKDYAGYDINGVFVSGDYDKDLFSIAAKYGRRFAQKNGWYYEPFAGLTWGRVGSADFMDSQNVRIHADSTISKIAMLGMQVGTNVKGMEYYGKVEVRHDFDGKMHVSAPDSTLPGAHAYEDMGGTWCKLAVGASRKINSNNSFYLDLEKDFGNKVKKPYAVSFGYRYTW